MHVTTYHRSLIICVYSDRHITEVMITCVYILSIRRHWARPLDFMYRSPDYVHTSASCFISLDCRFLTQYNWPWARNMCPRFVYSFLIFPRCSSRTLAIGIEGAVSRLVQLHNFIPVLRLSFQFCYSKHRRSCLLRIMMAVGVTLHSWRYSHIGV